MHTNQNPPPQPPAPVGHYESLRDRADACTIDGDLHQARRLYASALDCQPSRAEARVGLGVVEMAEGRTAQARHHFEAALALDAGCVEACAALALIHQEAREYEAAFDLYLRCLRLDGDHMLALLGLFQVSCQMGTFEMITRYLKLYLARHGDDVAVLFCLATLHARGGALKAAREAIARVLLLQPAHAEAAALARRIDQAIRLQGSGELIA